MFDDKPAIGRKRLTFASLESTNSLAATYAHDSLNHGLVITAQTQSAGRGQYQRVWQAPAGTSILMSVLLFPPPNLRRPAILTAWAALSVCETIRQATGLEATIKWPNDVLVAGRKICGILCEGGAGHLVAGIGFNINQTAEDFEHLELPGATSLRICTGDWGDVEALTNQLIEQLDFGYQQLFRGEFDQMEAAWRRRLALIGQAVAIEKMDGSRLHGHLRELAFDGIVVESGDNVIHVAPEMIRHINAIDVIPRQRNY